MKHRARVSIHIQKPKHQANIKNKTEKFHINYLMFTIHYTKDDRGRAVAMAMLPKPPPTKPITLPDSVVLAERRERSSERN